MRSYRIHFRFLDFAGEPTTKPLDFITKYTLERLILRPSFWSLLAVLITPSGLRWYASRTAFTSSPDGTGSLGLPGGRCWCSTPVLMYSAHNLWTCRRVTCISRATIPASLPFFISKMMYRMDLSVNFGNNVSLDLCSLKYSSQVRLIAFKRHDSWIIHHSNACHRFLRKLYNTILCETSMT